MTEGSRRKIQDNFSFWPVNFLRGEITITQLVALLHFLINVQPQRLHFCLWEGFYLRKYTYMRRNCAIKWFKALYRILSLRRFSNDCVVYRIIWSLIWRKVVLLRLDSRRWHPYGKLLEFILGRILPWNSSLFFIFLYSFLPLKRKVGFELP